MADVIAIDARRALEALRHTWGDAWHFTYDGVYHAIPKDPRRRPLKDRTPADLAGQLMRQPSC
jgi:hypothetical protein